MIYTYEYLGRRHWFGNEIRRKYSPRYWLLRFAWIFCCSYIPGIRRKEHEKKSWCNDWTVEIWMSVSIDIPGRHRDGRERVIDNYSGFEVSIVELISKQKERWIGLGYNHTHTHPHPRNYRQHIWGCFSSYGWCCNEWNSKYRHIGQSK